MTLDRNEYSIDWLEFILTSVKHNWKLKGTLKKVENSLYDIYGKEYSKELVNRLYFHCEKFLDDL